MELGICVEHNREFEAYDTVLNVLVCPSCVMFGKSKGHDVCSIEEALSLIRE